MSEVLSVQFQTLVSYVSLGQQYCCPVSSRPEACPHMFPYWP